MATDKPISAFPALAAANVDPTDEFIVVDPTDTSSALTGTTKKLLLEDLLNNPNNGVVTGWPTPSLGTAAPGRIVRTAQNGTVFQSMGGTLTQYAFLDSAGDEVMALLESGEGSITDGPVKGDVFVGSSVVPTISKTAGTATVTSLKLWTPSNGGGNSTNAGGLFSFTVSGTGSWTFQLNFSGSGYVNPPNIGLTPATAQFGALFPYVAIVNGSSFTFSGGDFSSTGSYGIFYTVIG